MADIRNVSQEPLKTNVKHDPKVSNAELKCQELKAVNTISPLKSLIYPRSIKFQQPIRTIKIFLKSVENRILHDF